jgi:hypothetical protein
MISRCSLIPVHAGYQYPNDPLRSHRKKKVREFPVPRRDVTSKLSLGGNNDVITELFLPRGSLVSDIPAGDGKLVNLFYGVPTVFLLRLKTTWGYPEPAGISTREAMQANDVPQIPDFLP